MYEHNNFEQHYIETNGHKIFFSVSGKEDGVPVIYVHGGPGGGTEPKEARYFDPSYYKVILFDQRGCGKSTPSASVKNNTTQDLINDMEAIRKTLNIDKWLVFGGSWGTTLSLLYSEAHPSRVEHLILRGVFLGRQADLDWLYGPNGASNFFCDEYQKFKDFVPKNRQDDLIGYYYEQILSKDPAASAKAAEYWANWEMSIITLLPKPVQWDNIQTVINFSILETHYFVNKCFIKENQILDNVKKIQNIPTHIIHGRYDIDCRPSGAYELSKHLNKCNLKFVEGAGHSTKEPSIEKALFDIMEQLKH